MALLSLVFIFFATNFATTHAQLNVESKTIDVNLLVEGCNNNLICEPITGGETIANCPLDCTPAPTPETEDEQQTTDTTSNRAGNRRAFEEPTTSTRSDFQILNFIVDPGLLDVSFSWETDVLTVSSVRIGTDGDMGTAAAAEYGFRKDHFFYFTGLRPGISYQYEVVFADRYGTLKKETGFFTTNPVSSLPSVQQDQLEPIDALVVTYDDGVANVSWKNPDSDLFDYVRVVRTTEKPASEPLSGITVYEGSAEQVVDSGVTPGTTYYYTFFAKYNNGLYADGAPIETLYAPEPELQERVVTFEPTFGDETFSVFDFTFVQKNTGLIWEDKMLHAEPGQPIVVRFRKQEIFAPLDRLYLDVTYYDEAGNTIQRSFKKFIYRPEIGSYEITIEPAGENQTILFGLTKYDINGFVERVFGKIAVGTYSRGDQQYLVGGVTCRGFATGFEHFKNVLFCTLPWAYILLSAFVAVLMWCLYKKAQKNV